MDRLTIVVETGNAAFADDFCGELTALLLQLASNLRYADCAGDCVGSVGVDSYGNLVARVFGDVGAPSV